MLLLIFYIDRSLLPLLPHKNRFFYSICVHLRRNFKPTLLGKLNFYFFYY